MKPGDKVHYIPFEGADASQFENGIIKTLHPDGDKAWVVYHCAGERENYWKYTGALTNFSDLREGWIEPIEPETKFSYN